MPPEVRPGVAARLARKALAFCADEASLDALRRALPEGWQLVPVQSTAQAGEFHAILLYRFVLLDLDERAAFDALQILHAIRSDMMLNIAVFGFGGDAALRDAARVARIDRSFGRDEIVDMLPKLCASYAW